MTEREVGELSARVTAIERDIKGLRSDVREIRDCLLAQRGGRRAMVLIGSAAASIGGLMGVFGPMLLGM